MVPFGSWLSGKGVISHSWNCIFNERGFSDYQVGGGFRVYIYHLA